LVEDNFKIGIHLELEQSSLADIQKQIEKTIATATQNAMGNAKTGSIGPSTGSLKSAQSSVGIKGGDFPKAIDAIMKSNFKSFDASVSQMSASIDKLTVALDKQARGVSPTSAGGGPVQPEKTQTKALSGQERALSELGRQLGFLNKIIASGGDRGRQADQQRDKVLGKAKRIASQPQRLAEQANKNLRKSVEIDKKLNAVKEKEVAIRNEYLSQLKKDAAGFRRGGFSASGGGRDPLEATKSRPTVGGTQANQKAQSLNRAKTAREEPVSSLSQPKPVRESQGQAAGKAPSGTDERRSLVAAIAKGAGTGGGGGPRGIPEHVDYAKQAQQDITAAGKTLANTLELIGKHMPQYKGTDIAKAFNLPSPKDLRVREGAAPTIRSGEGQERHLGAVVSIIGNAVTRLDRITHNFQGIEQDIAKIADANRRDSARGGTGTRDALQKLMRNRMGDAPMYEGHQAMGSFMKAGEIKMVMQPDQKTAARIMSKGDEGRIDAPKLGEVEATLFRMTRAGKQFVQAGVEVVSMLGLTEEAAAKMADPKNWTLKRNKRTGEMEGTITSKMQTRQVREFQAGGAQTMKQGRLLFMKSISKITGGQEPVIQSPFMKKMADQGHITPSALNLKTSIMSARNVPQLHEDQSLITRKAAKAAGMFATKTKFIKDPAEDLQVGMGLQDKQHMGINAAGKAVEMALHGTAATITSMTKVLVNDIPMTKIDYEEFNAPGTGMKMATLPGVKSIMKVVSDEEMAATGAPKGTEVLTSAEGMMRRGDYQDVITMLSTAMTDGGKVSAQLIYDAITGALDNNPNLEMMDAVKQVAGEHGLDPNVAFKATQGALKAGGGPQKALQGTVPWYRLEKEGETGPSSIKDRYLDPVTTTAMTQRNETRAYAAAAEERAHLVVAKEQEDYHKVLRSLSGATENVTAGLRKMNPEEFSKMPGKTVMPEELKKTLADEDFAKGAFNLQLPKFGGGAEDFYMPGMGTAVGQREAVTDPDTGLATVNPLTKAFEQVRQSAMEIKAARGELDPSESPEVQQEGAEFVNRMMNRQIDELKPHLNKKGTGIATEEGKQIAAQLVSAWMPLIKMMESAGMSAGISYKERSTTGVEKEQRFASGPQKYVNIPKDDFQRLNRMRDVLAIRAGGDVNEASAEQREKGVQEFESIRSIGPIFKDIEMLNAAMKILGKTAAEDEVHMAGLWATLEEGKGVVLDAISEQGFGKSGTPAREELRKVAQTRGAGVQAGSMYSKAVQYDVDITDDLKVTEKHLRAIGKAGGDVGDALSALERIRSLQVSEDILPRDAILLSKTDYANMKSAVKRDARTMGEELTDEQVEGRMTRGIVGRFPITGGESQRPMRFLEDKTGRLPEGKVGVPGTFAVGSDQDLKTMRGPLEGFKKSLIEIINVNNGFGAAAEEARGKLKEINSAMDGTTQAFDLSTSNLDFDGDNLVEAAANSEEAAQLLRTSVELLKQVGFSAQQALRTVLGNLEGPEQDYSNLKGINAAYGSLVKGRPAGSLLTRPPMDDADTARREAEGLVGGKLSVGILSDAFNIFHQAVLGGSKLTSDAFATAKDLIMLNINKGLAAKQGVGDEAGPLGLLGDVAQGPEGIKRIRAGMASGKGLYGEMGRKNEEMRAKFAEMLPATDPAELTQMALQEGILKEGEEVTPSNYKSVVDQLMDKMDISGQLQSIWDRIESNLRESLRKQGLGSADIDTEVKRLTTVDKKTGAIPGVDLRSLTDEPFQISKKKGAEQLRKMTRMDRAREVLNANFEDLNMGEIDLDPAEPRKLSADLEGWLQGVMSLAGVLSDEDIRGMGRDPQSVAGMYQPGPPGSTPGAGAVMLGESTRVRPLKAAVEALEKMESGAIQRLPKTLAFVERAIESVTQTLGHETIHQASKVPGTEAFKARQQISTQLMEGPGSGLIGENRDAILSAARALPSIATQEDLYDQLKSTAKFGAEEGQTRIGSDVGEGEFTGMTADDAVAKQGQKYMNMVAEEVMAHLNNPEKWMEIFKTIPEGTREVLLGMFTKIRSEMSELFEGPLGEQAQGLISRVQALGAQGTPEAAGVRDEAQRRIGMAGHAELQDKNKQVGLVEKILKDARSDYGLQAGDIDKRTGLLETKGAVSFPLEHRPGIDSSAMGMRKDLLKMAEDPMGMSAPDVSNLRDKFTDDAKAYRREVEAEPEDVGGGKKGGRAAYVKAMQEFDAAELQMYVNRSKLLEDAAQLLRETGKEGGPEFRAVLEELGETIGRAKNNLMRLNIAGTGGQQGLAIQKATGQMREEAGPMGLGIVPGKESYEQIVKMRGPRGTKEQPTLGKDFIEQGLGKTLLDVQQAIAAGASKTEQWKIIWKELQQEPEKFAENLQRVADILKEFGGNMQSEFGKAAPATQDIQSIAKIAGDAHVAVQKLPERPSTAEDLQRMTTELPAVRKAAFGGRDLKDMIRQQEAAMEATRKQFENDLNEMLAAGIQPKGGRHVDSGRKLDIQGPNNMVLKSFNLTAKKGVDGYTASLKEATKAAGGLTGAMRNSLRRVVQWGFATGIVYGTIRAFRSMMQTITEVETKITALKKVMDTSITNFEKMQDSASGFAQEFGVSISDVLDGMVVYGQQGLKVNKIMERTRATMLAVNVTTLSAVQATEALTAAHKVFGDQVSNSAGFVDAWAAVAAKHAITAADLADAVKRSGAAAGVAGVGFNDFLGIVTAIGSVTRQTGKEIATSTKFMFRAMRRPTAQKELAGMDIKSMDPGGDFRPAVDIMTELAGRWDNLTRAQQVNLAQAMAGIRHYNSFIVLMNNFDEALLASADAANSQGFAMRKNRLSMQTLAKQMTVMQESAKGVVLQLGKIVLPAAAFGVEAVSAMTQALGSLPPVLLQVMAGFTGLGLVVHKGADILADTMDAMRSGEVSMGTPVKTRSLIAGKVLGMGRGIKAGWQGAAGAGVAADAVTGLGRVAGRTRKLVDGLGASLFAIGTGSAFAGKGLKAAAASAKLLNAALVTTIGGAVLVAIGVGAMFAYNAYKKATRSAKDFEQSQEDIIGKSEDAASRLRSQMTQADALALAYARIGKAQTNMADAERTSSAIAEGRFRGAATAAQKYSNMLAEISTNLGKADPSKILGVTDTGDLIVGIADNFKSLTAAALDSQNAITAALKVETIQAYADELEKPLAKFNQVIARMQKITEERKKNAGSGGFEIRGLGELLAVEKQRVSLSAELVENAGEVKRIFESIPKFEDFSEAMEQIPKIKKELDAYAKTGIFGRGATGGSVVQQFMGRQAGLGGVLDYQNTQSPGLTANAFLERGIRGISGTGDQGALASIEMEKQIVLLSNEAAKSLGIGAQTMFSDFSASTGELMLLYADADGRLQSISAAKVEEHARMLEGEAGAYADHIITFSKKEVDAAAEGTRRLLTTQFTGALAGIRVPSGGMPNVGPARAAELSIDQRVMKSLPEDIQKMSEVQKEFNALAKEYSEILQSDVKGAYTEAGETSKVLKVATHDVLEMAVRLQRQGFELSVLANYEKMQQKLNQTLEQSARAAKDYESAERDKNRFLTINAGAMQGMSPVPTLDLGKAFKELSGLEKLAIESPGFGGALSEMKIGTDTRQRDFDTMTELKKQLADFDEARADMGQAGSEMEAAQDQKLLSALAKGANQGQIAMIAALNDASLNEIEWLSAQYDTQVKILDELGLQSKLLAAAKPEDRQKIFNEAIRGTSFDEITAAFNKARGSADASVGAIQASLGMIRTQKGFEARGVEGMSEDTAKLVRDAVKLANASLSRDTKKEAIRLPSGKAGYDPSPTTEVWGLETMAQDAWIIKGHALFQSADELSEALKGVTREAVISEEGGLANLKAEIAKRSGGSAAEKDKALKEQEKLEAQILETRAQHQAAGNKIRQRINDQISNLQASLEEGSSELQKASQEVRLAQSARNLATSLEDMVKEFKKAEAAVVIKLKSDLEGPWARVGQPGFKTSFEQRREELKSGSNRPMSLGQMQQRDIDRKKVDFDEKQARIDQKQAVETAALRRQQQQAERIRTKMQDIMEDPDQALETRSQAKSFFETLGAELEVSEQAEKRGDKLFFKGIPSLEGLGQLADSVKATAKKKAADLTKLKLVDAHVTGQRETVNAITESRKVAELQLKELVGIKKAIKKEGVDPTDTGDVSAPDFGPTDSSIASGRSTTTAGTTGAASTTAAGSEVASTPRSGYKSVFGDTLYNQSPASASLPAGIGNLGDTSWSGDPAMRKAMMEQAQKKAAGPLGAQESTAGTVAASTALTLAKTSSPLAQSARSVDIPGEGRITSSLTRIGDDLLVAADVLDGKIVGLQEFEIVPTQPGVAGTGKSIQARHIAGTPDATGINLPENLQDKGFGSKRIQKVIEWGKAQGFDEFRTTPTPSGPQAGAVLKGARAAGTPADFHPSAELISKDIGFTTKDGKTPALTARLQDPDLSFQTELNRDARLRQMQADAPDFDREVRAIEDTLVRSQGDAAYKDAAKRASSAPEINATIDRARPRAPDLGDDAYLNALNKIQNPLDFDPYDVKVSPDISGRVDGRPPETPFHQKSPEVERMDIEAEYKAKAADAANTKAMDADLAQTRQHFDDVRAKARDPFGPGKPMGDEALDLAAKPRPVTPLPESAVHRPLAAVDSVTDAAAAGDGKWSKMLKASKHLKPLAKGAGGAGLLAEATELAVTLADAGLASSVGEQKQAGARAGGQAIGAAGVLGLTAAGGTLGMAGGPLAPVTAPMGALGGMVLGGGLMMADSMMGTNYLDQAGAWADEKSGGRITDATTWAGQKLMGTEGIPVAPLPTTTPGQAVPMSPAQTQQGLDQYAALGMPSPFTGAAAPAAPVDKNAPGYWENQINQQLLAGGTDPSTIGQTPGMISGRGTDDTGFMGPRLLEDIRNPSTAVPGAGTAPKPNYAAMYRMGDAESAGGAFEDRNAIYNRELAASAGTKITDLTSAPKMTPKEEFGREMSTGLSDAEKNIGVKAALASGARTFSSATDKRAGGIDTLLSSGEMAGGGTVDLNAAMRRMQQARQPQTATPLPEAPQATGANEALVQTADNKRNLVQASEPAAATPDQRAARQELSSEARETGGGNEELSKAIDSLNSKLDDLGDIKVDTSDLQGDLGSIATAIDGIKTSTLNVSVVGEPSVRVTNLSDINVGSTDSSQDVGAIGSAVTGLTSQVTALEGVDAILQKSITDNTIKLNALPDADAVNQANTALTNLQVIVATIPEVSTIATVASVSEVDGKVTAVDVRVTELDTKTTQVDDAIRTELDAERSRINTLDSTVNDAVSTAGDAKTEVGLATTDAAAAKVAAGEAKTAADLAQTEATDAVTKVDALVLTVNSNKGTHTTDISAVKTTLIDHDKRISANVKVAGEGLTTAKRAESIAGTANAAANKRG
jgi:TP901 family phage tail tape measure protein